MKLPILSKFLNDFEETDNDVEILFSPSEKEEIKFEIYSDGNLKALSSVPDLSNVPKEAYDNLAKLYYEYLSQMDTDSFEINREWALNILDLMLKLNEDL